MIAGVIFTQAYHQLLFYNLLSLPLPYILLYLITFPNTPCNVRIISNTSCWSSVTLYFTCFVDTSSQCWIFFFLDCSLLTGFPSISLSVFSLCLKVDTPQYPISSFMLCFVSVCTAAICLSWDYISSVHSLSLFLSSRPLIEIPQWIYEGISCSTNPKIN